MFEKFRGKKPSYISTPTREQRNKETKKEKETKKQRNKGRERNKETKKQRNKETKKQTWPE